MQVSKVGCVGKTYALAKLNDSSGGKKSKRRSKEERKEMVETFVKREEIITLSHQDTQALHKMYVEAVLAQHNQQFRHQASNNGAFPSLHLTHKEVGGSYYTVREIFRELIQDNRVLAPPKLPPGEQNLENLDSFLDNNPLGSISFDPNVHGLLPKDNQTLVKEYESRREKVFNTKRVSEMHRQNLDNDDLVNGSSHATMKSEDIVEPERMKPLMGRVLDGHKGETEVAPCEGQIRHLSEDVVVETFPLRPVSSMVYNVDAKASEKELLDGDLEVEANNNSYAAVNTVENIALNSKYLDSNDSSSSLQHSTFKETTTDKNKLEMQPGDTVQKQTADATSDEINIDSCVEAAATESASQETNPIFSFMKTVVAAFVKFWSE